MNLFQRGQFILNSGAESKWKLECDALSDADWEAVAVMVSELVEPFCLVSGVPRGGQRLERPLKQYESSGKILIVDDVLTTGGSMKRFAMTNYPQKQLGTDIIGAVLFARGPCPPWVRAVFQMPECFWIKK